MEHHPKNKVYQNIKALFPIDYEENQLPDYLNLFLKVLSEKVDNNGSSRISGKYGQEVYKELTEKYSKIPLECEDPISRCAELISDLFSGVPRWRSPHLQYNVGASVNTAAVALYTLALEENIYSINDGLAGNALVAEQAVSKILANLANIEKEAHGLFTFGGTATNLYAIKVGTRKAAPDSGKKGIPKNMKVMIAQDGHFSHGVSADWLGTGTDNVVVIKPNLDRTSNLEDAENKMRKIFRDGNLLSTIIINGGTTYAHTIDDIESFVKLRDKIVCDYSLPYKPHLHVDSVIGWAWLMFKDYDFKKNDLGIEPSTLYNIKKQYDKISKVKYADSWGIDFHKGVGACPVDSSIVMMNDIRDLTLLSKKVSPITDTHHVAPEFSFCSPSDFTLETSRASGAALSALASLHTLGVKGYQRNLANLLEMTFLTRDLLKNYEDIRVCNEDSLGYVTMMRFYPPELKNDVRKFVETTSTEEGVKDFIDQVNKYMKNFFTWDYKTRMLTKIGVEYSFSSGFLVSPTGIKVAAAKLYPVSPRFNERYAKKAVETIVDQKRLFDTRWSKS